MLTGRAKPKKIRSRDRATWPSTSAAPDGVRAGDSKRAAEAGRGAGSACTREAPLMQPVRNGEAPDRRAAAEAAAEAAAAAAATQPLATTFAADSAAVAAGGISFGRDEILQSKRTESCLRGIRSIY